ncbi:Spb1 C-terminal domain-containing protein [Armillaria novae-zelandiae]|uniref:Spb1 C-terminal domain-containing protein n=1 Tax=Armillaria novae-zelandiae TaxID=153914 RepID=A0AA39TBR0_9AGAR|nr:Spb1 C-terminal domain-containing protein [Armillaria novae-zelandiae]
MGKAQKKTGKGRLDKYYKLAKEQGYRARSAFKLIQLNKKYAFLESARCCIDLCAAPGGWLQVASVIVGVDLVPIKPIPRVVTFASDITTPQCRNLLRGELKDWKADIVLHDGAPNVGTAWIQDAYSQSELVLMSLKLAVEFLVKGGTFVTKVFRSADYNNLIWVFNQLFGKVEATKPPSSREFHAPKHIDPKFLDPKHVFKDLTASISEGADKGTVNSHAQANVFQPEKKRRKRDGYADGDYTLFKACPVSEFVNSQDPISVLGSVNRIIFNTEDEKTWLDLPLTTADVKANLEDLKVLGRGDFKTLLKWRSVLREELGIDVKTKEAEEITETVEVTEELERLNAEAAARTKRERRRANEIRTRTIQRMQLQMTAPLDIGLEQHDASLGVGQDDMFDLETTENHLRRRGYLARFANGEGSDDDDDIETRQNDDGPEALDSDEERERKLQGLEAELDGLYDAYQVHLRERDAKFKVKEAREKNGHREEWGGIKGSQEENSDEESGSEGGGYDTLHRVNDDSNESSDDESDIDDAPSKKRRRTDDAPDGSKKSRLVTKLQEPSNQAASVWFSRDVFANMDNLDDISDGDESDDVDESFQVPESQHDDDDDDFEIVPQENDDTVDMWDVEGENEDEAKQAKIKALGLVTPEAVTLAQQLVNREKTRTQLINDGFNRYSLNSKDGLPSWFLDDESKHYKPNLPVTKEAVAALRARQRALDARPIKKIAEAKGRKKFRAAQRLEKAMRKAEGVNDTADMTEREKAQQIEKLMRKGMSSGGKAKKEVKLVVAKGDHKGVKGRPKGVKGRYTMVDSRMKKEVRAKKRIEKANKKRKRT